MKHIELGHQAHCQRIVRVNCGELLLLLLLTLHGKHVSLEHGDLHVSRHAQSIGHGCEDLFELLLVSDGQHALAELDGALERLHLVVLLKSLQDSLN